MKKGGFHMRTLAYVVEACPRLTKLGLTSLDSSSYAAGREELLESELLVQQVRGWLRREVPPVPLRGRRPASSYWVKHIAERSLGTYVPNGVLIAAALLEGYVVSPSGDPQDPNMYFGMDRKVLAKLDV